MSARECDALTARMMATSPFSIETVTPQTIVAAISRGDAALDAVVARAPQAALRALRESAGRPCVGQLLASIVRAAPDALVGRIAGTGGQLGQLARTLADGRMGTFTAECVLSDPQLWRRL
jgi:hypothetical protein